MKKSIVEIRSDRHKTILGSSRNIAGNLEESQLTAKAKRLADLFRPPFDIMFKGGFEEVRKREKKGDKNTDKHKILTWCP